MNEPTKEQIQWFWEQCGLEYHDGYFFDIQGKQIIAERHILDLNNLFKYAVPLLYSCELIKTGRPDYHGRWCAYVRLKDEVGKTSSMQDKDPALALFWAIYKCFGGKE